MTIGALLINLGTPDSPNPNDVGRYLKEFLNDPYVIDIPKPLRWFLVNVLIVPRRKYTSAEAYKTIWGERGSPLKYHLEDLVQAMRRYQAEHDQQSKIVFEMAMRYGSPSISSSLKKLKEQKIDRLIVVPLYPQFAESSTQSTLDEVDRALKVLEWKPQVVKVKEFFANKGHATAWADLLAQVLMQSEKEYVKRRMHVLFSYHGLPERHLLKSEAKFHPSSRVCLDGGKPTSKESLNRKYECCERAIRDRLPCLTTCYRAQSIANTEEIVAALRGQGHVLGKDMYSTSFQSRLGRTPWIRPYTDNEIVRLAKEGVEHLIVVNPSFVADCLETIEEIGDRAQHEFLQAGGKEFSRVPCLNAHPKWVSALTEIIKGQISESAEPRR